MSLGAIPHQVVKNSVGNVVHGTGICAIDGTNAENIQFTGTPQVSINGIQYTFSAEAELDISTEVDNVADLTAVADGYTVIFVVEVDASQNYTVAQGDAVANADITAGTKSAHWPVATGNGVAALGAVKVKNATGSDFTFGTTDLDTAGITDTYYNLSHYPSN